MTIRDELRRRILILDGAMGTMLQKRGFCGNSESLNLSDPDMILGIHKAYIEAGADIIETNTFGANAISQEEYGCSSQAHLMALEGARIARKAADLASSEGRKVWVAGSVGPTGKSLSLASDLSDPAWRKYSFDEMAAAFADQISGLREGGVDFILIETCFDALNVKAALHALSEVAPDLPVAVSVSVSDRSGRTLTGQTLEAFYHSVEHGRLISFGLNCSLGAAELEPLLEEVSAFAACPVICYPNAGLPDEMGAYTETPQQTAAAVAAMAAKGLLNIAGGCCGTTPDHIAAIAAALKDISPRTVPSGAGGPLAVSGLESVVIDRSRNFTNVGERTNVAGSRKFARLIASGAYEEALQVAAGQIEGGADVIDINMDDPMLDPALQMRTFLRYISNDPAVARAAIMVDSSHWEAVLEGLKNAQGKCIVNSISLKEGEAEFLRKAREIRRLGGAMVVMAFDEEGQATTYERKIEVCRRSYDLLIREAGVLPHDIIFDVNVLSVGTGLAEHARYGVDFIEAVRWVKTNLPGALTSGGISNLSFAFRGNNPVREAMHSAFLYHATSAGLDMGIVNPGMLQIYDSIDPVLLEAVEDVILDRRPDATERMLSLISGMSAAAPSAVAQESFASGQSTSASIPVSERLSVALVKGGSASLREDVLESLAEKGRAVDVIEGPLMAGMQKVGEFFAEGKMFLPQVVKSAKVMRDAVDVLRPFMEAEAGESGVRRPRVLIATVKGDVHDIGKNITAIVLGCNGFDVTDLGVMVPKETILEKAAETGADIIAVSGLITPSLHQMEELCREMSARGMTTPLFVGGATTSALHTAVKLAPLYDHVYHGADASASAVMAKRYMMDPDAFERSAHDAQASIRSLYESGRKLVPNPAADGGQGSGEVPSDLHFKDIPYKEIPIGELMPHFDWRMFFAVWGIKGQAMSSPQARALKADAETVIADASKDGRFGVRMSVRFVSCRREGDDVVAVDGSGLRFPMLRQEVAPFQSLADFVSDKPEGSPAGVFAISVHDNEHPLGCSCLACALAAGNAEYDPMLLRSIKVTLAEAASSWLDSALGSECEGAGVKIVKPAAGYLSCPDHSLKADVLAALPGSSRLEIHLTESYSMIPDASICGFIFAAPGACYPEIRSISRETLGSYARRRGMDMKKAEALLGFMCD